MTAQKSNEKPMKRDLVVNDEKARRVNNVAPRKRPNITMDELSREGLTIERLEQINVPVLKYATQLTIHGTFPEDVPYGVGGYKNLTRNENGSLGVKYSALDVAKKELISRAAKLSKTGWHGSFSSSGFTLVRTFLNSETDAKEKTLVCYRSIPDDLYTGGKEAGRLMWGFGYYVEVQIGTIYEKDVWSFCKQMFGLTEAEYKKRLKAYQDERAREEQEYLAEQVKAEQERKARIAAKRQELIDAGFKPAQKLAEGYYAAAREGRFAVVFVFQYGGSWRFMTRKAETLEDLKPFEYSKRKGGLPFKTENFNMFFHLKQQAPQPVESAEDGRLLKVEHDRDWTWLTFSGKPSETIRQALKDHNGRFSGRRMAWYFTEHVSEREIRNWIGA